jgi:hypothetical protein
MLTFKTQESHEQTFTPHAKLEPFALDLKNNCGVDQIGPQTASDNEIARSINHV